MKRAQKMLLAAAGSLISASTSWADTLPTHRIPAALAVEAANETVAACARQGYRETAVVLDADGAIIAALRGDGAGIHTLDSAHDKAYTTVSFKNDTLRTLPSLARPSSTGVGNTSTSAVAPASYFSRSSVMTAYPRHERGGAERGLRATRAEV